MMKIILVEFPWQAEKICKDKKFNDYAIISVDPEASYILKKNNYHYFETHEICNHENLWKRYKNITENSLQISKILDKYLWKFDKRFRELEWKFFDDFHLAIKISYDQSYYYAELISELIKRFNPTEITVANTQSIKLDKQLLIDRNISLFKFLLNDLKTNETKIEIKYMNHETKNFNKVIQNNFFKKQIKEKFKNIYLKLIFFYNYFVTKPEYFAVGGYEIDKFKKLYSNESKKYICYRHENISHKDSNNKWKYFDDFYKALNNDAEFKSILRHQKNDFNNLFFSIIFKISSKFENFIKEYSIAKKIINKINPKCLIFESMNPFYSPTVIFRKICKNLNIPFVTWAHGGHNHYSLHGWDVSDYRFCKNHISYGRHLEEVLNDDKSIINQLNFCKDLKIYPVGSARFDYFIKKKKLKKKTKKKRETYIALWSLLCGNKKSILFWL